MLNIFFSSKADRRAAFLVLMRGLAPLRKSTPTGGFAEMAMNYLFERGTLGRPS